MFSFYGTRSFTIARTFHRSKYEYERLTYPHLSRDTYATCTDAISGISKFFSFIFFLFRLHCLLASGARARPRKPSKNGDCSNTTANLSVTHSVRSKLIRKRWRRRRRRISPLFRCITTFYECVLRTFPVCTAAMPMTATSHRVLATTAYLLFVAKRVINPLCINMYVCTRRRSAKSQEKQTLCQKLRFRVVLYACVFVVVPQSTPKTRQKI